MVNKHKKAFSTSYDFMEMQIKAIGSCHTPIRMTKFRTLTMSHAGTEKKQQKLIQFC